MQCTLEVLINNSYLNGYIVTFNNNPMLVKCKLDKGMVLNTLVHIHIFNPLKGEIILRGTINSIVNNMVKIINVKCIEIKQKRKDARVRVEFTLYVNTIQVDRSQPIVLSKYILFKTVDISSSGILLNSQLNFPQNISFYLELPIGDTISCIASVVRKEEREDGIYYGCRLKFTDESKADKIREFVFKKQIEIYKSKSLLKVIDF